MSFYGRAVYEQGDLFKKIVVENQNGEQVICTPDEFQDKLIFKEGDSWIKLEGLNENDQIKFFHNNFIPEAATEISIAKNAQQLKFGDEIILQNLKVDEKGHVNLSDTDSKFILPAFSIDSNKIENAELLNLLSNDKILLEYNSIDHSLQIKHGNFNNTNTIVMPIHNGIDAEKHHINADFGSILRFPILVIDAYGHIECQEYQTIKMPEFDLSGENITINQNVKWQTW